MDPLTHTLAGVAIGRTLDRREGALAAVSVWTAIAASHLPDADSIAPFFTGDKIDYLLAHRGWTHTVLGAPVMAGAAVLLVVAWRAWRAGGGLPWVQRIPARDELPRLFGIALAATLAHLLGDSFNSYGVHPFSPAWTRWLYVDSVFIVEPLIIACLLPFAVAHAATRTRKVSWVGAAALVFGLLAWASPPAVPIAAGLWAGGWILAHRARPGLRLPAVGIAGVVALFVVAGFLARSRAAASVAAELPDEERLDVVSTPAPSNPFCWRVQTVGVQGAEYVARTGWVSLLPPLFDAASCYPAASATPNARLLPSPMTSGRSLAWQGEFRAPLSELARENEDCRVAALMGFIRVPFWGREGHRSHFSDLRYDLDGRRTFAEVGFENVLPSRCPVSPWTPPRADLLERASRMAAKPAGT